MQHLSSEELALNALGEATADETAHLQQCTQCAAEVEALRRVVTAGRTPSAAAELTRPPSSVWEGIHSALGLGETVRDDPFDAPSRPAVSGTGPEAAPAAAGTGPSAARTEPPAGPVPLEAARQRRNARRRLPQVLAAAAAAVVLAAAGTWGISRILADRTQVIAAVDLAPLPAYQDTGRAEVDQRPDGGRELVVTATGSDAQGFREVWLIAPDIERMVSLGTMEGTEGRFTIPANLDLNEYPIVDISDEPFDGNPTHSGDSILRGVLEP